MGAGPGAASDGRRRFTPAVATFAAAALLVVGGGAWAATTVLGGGGSGDGAAGPGGGGTAGVTAPAGLATGTADGTGRAFLAAWEEGRFDDMQALVQDRDVDVAEVYADLGKRLDLARVRAVPATATAGGTRLPFRATLTMTGVGAFAYTGAVPLVRTPAGWRVAFTPATVHPALERGQRLQLVEGAPPKVRVLDRTGRPLDRSADLAANLVGQVDAGQGATGLRRVLGEQLPVAVGRSLAVVEDRGEEVVRRLRTWGGAASRDVRTTLDLRVQGAAEKALASVPGKAALVALDTRTGGVLAAANRPIEGVPPAIATAYPPGSTFKIVTATAALLNGAGPSTTLSCPPTVNAGGRTFRNAEPGPSRRVTLTQAFAQSCNTAFISLAARLPDAALVDAARLYGFGSGPPLPVASVGGEVPAADSEVEAAAAAIGQGRVTASPLHMASVAAAVASGTWRQPRVLPCPSCEERDIPVAAQLRPMMRDVVRSGTGTRAAAPGGPVSGKTGTAEYGQGSPPPTHAWFVGWQGTTAFAVFVEDGSSGGLVAAPVAARFLRLLG